MSVRFLHAADLHLGLRLTRFDKTAATQIAEARFSALDNLKKAAIDRRVHFVIIAGDVFDDNAVPAALAERTLSALEGSSWPGEVFVIPGNHDPLTPGCVWDRDPWTREQSHKRVRVLRTSSPVPLSEFSATLFPCPLRHRTSIDDPTCWIAQHPRSSDSDIRIGIAHGSLRILPQLPEDDHLIPPDAADRLGLDYLALGHWHKPQRHGLRTAYPGTHEPMRFPDVSVGDSTGWEGYALDGGDERFADAGRGVAYFVEIAEPGAPPRIEDIDIGHLRWSAERVDVTGRTPGHLVKDFSNRPDILRTILRLRLEGVLSPQEYRRLEELRQVIEGRYHAGSTFDADAVLIEPTDDELGAVVGDGVLPRVLDRLKADMIADDEDRRAVATHALKILYRLAWEDRPA
jgi:DNA repair exonuclease SbcCD nuclease subunit